MIVFTLIINAKQIQAKMASVSKRDISCVKEMVNKKAGLEIDISVFFEVTLFFFL
jgi:hypothetical protein